MQLSFKTPAEIKSHSLIQFYQVKVLSEAIMRWDPFQRAQTWWSESTPEQEYDRYLNEHQMMTEARNGHLV